MSQSDREPRRYATGRLISSLLLLAFAGLAVYGAWAAYTSKINAGANPVQAGRINLVDNTSGDLFGSAGLNLAAGANPIERCYTLTNSNSADSVPVEVTLAMGVTGTGTILRDRLRFSVEQGQGSTGSGTGCTGFQQKATRAFLAGGATLSTEGAQPSSSQGATAGANSGAILSPSGQPNLLNKVTLSPGQSIPVRIRFFPTAGTTLPGGQSLTLTLAVDSISAAPGEI